MENIGSYNEISSKFAQNDKSFVLIYKSGHDQSDCAFNSLKSAVTSVNSAPVFFVDVNHVRDIHSKYGITSVPSLLIFEKSEFRNVVKGCQAESYFKALVEDAFYKASSTSEDKPQKSVTVYSTPTCSWCNTLKTWLRKNGVSYNDIDISRDEQAARDLVSRSGQQGVPQTDINGQIVVGFNQQRLKELLDIQ